MRHQALLWITVVAVLGSAASLLSADGGTLRGTVSAVVPSQTPDGTQALTVVLKGEGIWQAMVTVGPQNKEAYAVALGLKPGERVTVGWVVDGGRNVIREIVRGDAERRAETTPREGAAVEDRDAAERNAAEREAAKERAAKERELRMQEYKRAAEARRVAEAAGPDAKNRMRTLAKVVGVETGENGDVRTLKLRAVESGDESAFTVGKDRGSLYELLGKLKAGDGVRVTWKTEGGKPVLLEVGKTSAEPKTGEGGTRPGYGNRD